MLADSQDWSFVDIAADDPARALELENAPSAEALLRAVLDKFKESSSAGNLQVGMEQSASSQQDLRVVLQFHVGARLSDLFFNARTGYRAQFRSDLRTGLEYNRAFIDGLRHAIGSLPDMEVSARLLTPTFEDGGPLIIRWERVLASLDRVLSKVWFCARLMNGKGHVHQLPTGVTGPHLRLNEQTTWVALTRDESDAWLDAKGAFLGSNGPYQPKDPVVRAKRLQDTGEA